MNKISDWAKKAGAGLSVAAVSVLSFLNGNALASSPIDKARGGVNKVTVGNPDSMETMVQKILTAVFTVIGIVAVVMIVLGGVNYTTSQGDPSKVKKAKDTILYGVIGLVVALMAFAIVNFVLNSLQ